MERARPHHNEKGTLMPTGYTAEIYEGKDVTFERFALTCARGMGALILMRDDSMDAPIPDEFEPHTSYHDEAIANAEARLVQLRAMTPEEIIAANLAERAETLRQRAEAAVKTHDLRKRYQAMLGEVERWEPPTEHHVGLKKLMVEQLNESMRFDCGDPDDPVRWPEMPDADPADWFDKQVAKCESDLTYHAEEIAKEVERARTRTEWVRALKASLGLLNVDAS